MGRCIMLGYVGPFSVVSTLGAFVPLPDAALPPSLKLWMATEF